MRAREHLGQQPVLGHGVGGAGAAGQVILVQRQIADHGRPEHDVAEHGAAETLRDLDERCPPGGGPVRPAADAGQPGEGRQEVQGHDDRHGDHERLRDDASWVLHLAGDGRHGVVAGVHPHSDGESIVQIAPQ